MKRRFHPIVKGLIILLVLAFVLPIVASALFDGPITLSLISVNIPDDIEAFLNRKMWLFNTDFEYIGYSTHDIHSPEIPIFFSWYTSRLPVYFSLGTDAYILCLVHYDSTKNEFDYVRTYIGSSRAIDSLTRRYAYSFH